MRQLLHDLWYGEPVVVLSMFAAAGTAIVGFVDLPAWAKAAIVALEAIAGVYGTRKLTTPEHLEQLSSEAGDELGPG